MKPIGVNMRHQFVNSHELNESANNVALAGSYPSQWNIGDVVMFQPDVLKIDDATNSGFYGIKARVERVSFDEGKVLYDVAVHDGEDGWYTNYPIQNIDSYFIRPWKA